MNTEAEIVNVPKHPPFGIINSQGISSLFELTAELDIAVESLSFKVYFPSSLLE
jgi:hypothetical protein